MGKIEFYTSVAYKERQAEIARRNWQRGIYNSLHKQEKRQCSNGKCGKWFEVTPADTKKFCSRKCAAQVNNPKRNSITPEAKEKIITLYQKGLSMQEISDKIGWKYGKVVHCMQKFNIPRRSRSEASYAKWNPNGDPFKIKNKLSQNEIFLKGLGLGLYWGEGDKSPFNTSVRMGNSDPRLIKKFREFLVKICGIKKEKLGYSLILFNDIDKEKAIKFWEDQLGIKRTQLGKVIEIPPQGKGTYKKKSQFGVLTFTFTNKKLKEQILEMIKMVK